MERYKKELIEMLMRYKPFDQSEEESMLKTLDFLKCNENVFGNSNVKGHITASVWLLDFSCENVLLTHHKKLGRWLQLGGHTEIGESIHESALREAFEESGLKELELLDKQIYDIDVHEIPARKDLPAHYHYDIRFLVRQTVPQEIVISEESNDLKWVKFQDIHHFTDNPSMKRMADKIINYI
ncbi:NUDIX hydrolase [Fusibacter bizertensis]